MPVINLLNDFSKPFPLTSSILGSEGKKAPGHNNGDNKKIFLVHVPISPVNA